MRSVLLIHWETLPAKAAMEIVLLALHPVTYGPILVAVGSAKMPVNAMRLLPSPAYFEYP